MVRTALDEKKQIECVTDKGQFGHIFCCQLLAVVNQTTPNAWAERNVYCYLYNSMIIRYKQGSHKNF